MTTNSKEWIQNSTAALKVVLGVVQSIISFFTKGDVTDGVLEHLTDCSDAFDTLYIGSEKFPQHDF